jgi:hypothetical protein
MPGTKVYYENMKTNTVYKVQRACIIIGASCDSLNTPDFILGYSHLSPSGYSMSNLE